MCAAHWHKVGVILHSKSWRNSGFLIIFACSGGIVPPAFKHLIFLHLWLKK